MNFSPTIADNATFAALAYGLPERTYTSPHLNSPSSDHGPIAVPADTPPPALQARILVVDDDPGVRFILEQVLSTAGYCIACAADGEEGWSALCTGSFDLLITDHDMPKLKGLGLLRLVRDLPFSLPVIMLSGRMPWDETDLQKLLQPGLAMEKPFSFGELLTNVRTLLPATAAVGSAKIEPAA